MNSKFDAFLQPVLRAAFMLVRLQGRNQVPKNERTKENGINVNPLLDVNHKIGLKFLLTDNLRKYRREKSIRWGQRESNGVQFR